MSQHILTDLDQTRARLLMNMLSVIRTSSTVTVLIGALLQLVPLLRSPATLLLLGAAVAHLLCVEAARYLVQRGRFPAAMLIFSIATIGVTAIGAVILSFPAICMGVIILVIVLSAFISGPSSTLVPAVSGMLIFSAIEFIADQPWTQRFTLTIAPGAALPLQIFFTLTLLGVATLACRMLAGELEQSTIENRRRAAEAEQSRTEQAALAVQLGQQVREQQALLEVVRQLEVPVIALADGVLALPLVGTLDSRRLDQIERVLLARLAAERIDLVLADLTAVPTVDTAVAARLLRLAQMVRLLGVEMALTGIKPVVAQTIVALGIEGLGMRSYATMQAALSSQMGERAL